MMGLQRARFRAKAAYEASKFRRPRRNMTTNGGFEDMGTAMPDMSSALNNKRDLR